MTGSSDLRSDESSPLATTDEWDEFLKRELEASVSAYVAKPALLARDFNDERQVRDDYAGRELLELVQNAADAAAEVGGNGRVLIDVTRTGLLVANTGQPFRPSGAASLMTAHLSDKPQRKRALIGAKGLGFRAILNWSMEPLISSGAMNLAFSREHSERAVRDLGEAHASISKFLAKRSPLPAPILPFPLFGQAIESIAATDPARNLIAQVRGLRAAGYDTVIAAPFVDEKAFSEAEKQTAEFAPRFLLFVRALAEIEIRVEGHPPRVWKKNATDADRIDLEIYDGDVSSKETWILRYADDELDDDGSRSADQPSRYELAVALRADAENEPGELHCYFPTSVTLPFPALFHATLEISSNRKSLKDNSAQNNAVLAKLAGFYAETLSNLRHEGSVLNALDFLHADESFPEQLRAFEAAAYAAAAKLPIIATIGGDHVRADQTRIGTRGYEKFFPERLFPDLARCGSSAELAVLGALGVDAMAAEDAVGVLLAADLDLDERSAVIAGIALNLPPNFHRRSFLIDQQDRPLKSTNSCFPPPTSGRPPVLPRWARAKFLSTPLWERLSAALPGTPREKILRLKAFGVEEYNLDGVARSLVRQAERLIERSPPTVQARVRGELLTALARLHGREGDTPPKFPPLTVQVCAKDGEWRPAKDMHLADGYGTSGGIVEALYATRPDLLLASSEAQGFSNATSDLGSFFEWIGVHRWPRVETLVDDDRSWRDILAALPDTFEVFDDRGTPREVQRDQLLRGYSARLSTEGIVGLEDILTGSSSDAIVAWLARDPRFDAVSGYDFSRAFEARRNAIEGFRLYKGDLPDLVRQRIRLVRWLECADGEKRSPAETMRDPGRLAGVFVRPKPLPEDAFRQFSLDQASWARGLANASVPSTLQDLSEAEIYDLLGDLEIRGLEPELIKRLYLHILELDDFKPERGAVARQTFMTTGSVQVRHGRVVDWLPVTSAFYVDRDGVPAFVREQLPLIDIPTRRGARQVSERLGIRPLGRQDFSFELADQIRAPEPDRSLLVHRFEESKKFVRALRSAASSDTTSLRRLERIELVPTTAISINVAINEEEFGGQLETWSHLLDGDALYIVIEPAMDPAKVLQLSASAVGEGLAELFEIQSGADFATMYALADDASRRIMFRKFLPNFSDDELEALFGEIEDPGLSIAPRFDQKLLATPATAEPPHSQEGRSEEIVPPPGVEQEAPSNPDQVEAHPVEIGEVVARDAQKTRLRVSRGSGSLGRAPKDPTKTGDAETWAAMFEEQQGRYPIAVGHLQGEDAFGCDLLSFASNADRQSFEETLDERLIARFVEVKSGGVRLTANEVRAAEREKERYWIYRILFEGERRELATLTAVSNPLSRQSALSAELMVDLNAIGDRAVYKVTPRVDDAEVDVAPAASMASDE